MKPPPPLNSDQTRALLDEVARHAVTPKTAVALLLMHGFSREQARHEVFLALGGSEFTETDASGRARYTGSGKLVSEVERALAEIE
jgi:hypothetical protein